MCYKVECKKCGKYTWAGCGKHLNSVYSSIEKGKHCMCSSWPGIDTSSEKSGNDGSSGGTSGSSAAGN
ncbi:hypothetical protein MLD38_028624 [Melastoma candidum]|uniref:Uncharacterized protein n=1 Tax=Melastoma candidum TaxID=119954 RepID=A0ACB9N357_9MYRT|nr:hypothetical protein MLD38_028624 [Melastoma candidum]